MEPASKDRSVMQAPVDSLKITASMTSSRSKWIALLIAAGIVTGWSRWTYSARTTDEVSSVALVIMITFVVWGEIIRLTIPPIGYWIRSNVRVEVNPSASPDPASRAYATVLAWTLVGALASFVVCEMYGTSFLIGAQLLQFFGLGWAYHQTLVVGLVLVAIGAVVLLTGVAAVLISLFAFASAISWAQIQPGFARQTASWLRLLFSSFGAPVGDGWISHRVP